MMTKHSIAAPGGQLEPPASVINRRRMLLGLAAASTAAAAVSGTVSDAAAPAPVENPKLIELASELPAVAAAFHVVNDKHKAEYREWDKKTPEAPSELAIPGTGDPWDTPGQPGEPEMWALGGYWWRSGAEKFPRRIVVKAWHVSVSINVARRKMRRARKAGNIADAMAAEAEIKRLKTLHSIAETYERDFEDIKSQAHAWHKKAYPVREVYRDAFERHVAAIMKEPDHTMEGLVIKAQALAEWDRVGSKFGEKLALNHGQNWQGQIAAAILRHAKAGGNDHN